MLNIKNMTFEDWVSNLIIADTDMCGLRMSTCYTEHPISGNMIDVALFVKCS